MYCLKNVDHLDANLEDTGQIDFFRIFKNGLKGLIKAFLDNIAPEMRVNFSGHTRMKSLHCFVLYFDEAIWIYFWKMPSLVLGHILLFLFKKFQFFQVHFVILSKFDNNGDVVAIFTLSFEVKSLINTSKCAFGDLLIYNKTVIKWKILHFSYILDFLFHI